MPSDFPPTLTPERIDAMLSGLAEVCFAGVIAAGERMQAALEPEPFERTARALQSLSRNLRQTIAMKHRFDRHQAKVAAVAAEEAQVAEIIEAEAARDALSHHHARARDRLGDLIWNEHEEDEAQALYDEVDEHLDALREQEPERFLQTSLDDLVAEVSETFAIGAFRPEVEDQPEPEPPPRPHVAPILVEVPPPPPDIEPDPPPEPYIPPWEKLRPGQVWPGSSGY